VVRFLAIPLILCGPLTAQSDLAILQIRIVEGEGAVYAIGARATRGITVQVTDETGKPVENAAVSFRLPDDGPTGAFSSGMRTEIAMTTADGRASVWGMQWNRVTGPMQIRITAAKWQARAGTVCGLFLSDAGAAATEPQRAVTPGWRSHRKIWLGIAIAAGAFAGAAALTSRGTSGQTGGAGVSAPQIGTPTIIIGKP
jgi:hypothetical protein